LHTKEALLLKQFALDVRAGLSSSPKYLPSRYFYDEKGDLLFQQIMELDEYYPTRCEMDVFNTHKGAILQAFTDGGTSFNLLEFGAGDGTKTKVLLRHFIAQQARFKYSPIDISQNVLDQLTDALNEELPKLTVQPLQGEYFAALKALGKDEGRRVVLFLGSNIGNFNEAMALRFLRQLGESLRPDDMLMIGMDLKKDPKRILDAYNDKDGVTRAFNMNLLQRINDELGANFNLAKYSHWPQYNPISGECRSFLVSKCDQEVYIEHLDETFEFKAWEGMNMEVSQKYDLDDINALASKSGFEVYKNLYDKDQYFVDSIWRKV